MISTRLTPLLLLLSFTMLLSCCAWLLLGRVRFAERLTERLRAIQSNTPSAAHGRKSRPGVVGAVAALGEILMRHRLLPRTTLHEAEMLLAGANLHGEAVLAGFVGSKVLLLAGLPPMAWMMAKIGGLSSHIALMIAVAGAIVALVLPDLLLGRRRRRRLVAIENGLPDGLDLLVICVDAGLAFEQALARVTRDIASVHPDLAEEFALTVNALRISPDRRAALRDMGARLEADFLRQLATTLAQALQLGAPLSQALRLLAQELRREQMIRIEARAARLPVMLTIPMVIFIMPTVLLVVCGPAAVQMLRTF
jgi:tight adherence protein C